MGLKIIYIAFLSILFISCQTVKNEQECVAETISQDKEVSFIKKVFSKSVPDYSPLQYKKWITDPENGLLLTKEIDGYKIKLMYKPAEFCALIENLNGYANNKAFNTAVKKYENAHYFTLSIGSLDGKTEMVKMNNDSRELYYQKVGYFSFNAQKDFKLIANKDTLNCSVYHMERAYGTIPYNTFLMGFSYETKTNSDLQLVYDDKVLGLGPVKFTIKKENLEELPKVKI